MIEQIVTIPIRTDLNGMFYRIDTSYMIIPNFIVHLVVFAFMFTGIMYCLYLNTLPRVYEEFPNLNRWNLPCL